MKRSSASWLTTSVIMQRERNEKRSAIASIWLHGGLKICIVDEFSFLARIASFPAGKSKKTRNGFEMERRVLEKRGLKKALTDRRTEMTHKPSPMTHKYKAH